MNRDYIEQNQIIERYILGKLSNYECLEFEAYYLEQPDILDEIEITERFLIGMKYVREEKSTSNHVSVAKSLWVWLTEKDVVGKPAFVFSMCMVLALPVVSMVMVSDSREETAALMEELALYRSPQENTPIVPVQLSRSLGSTSSIKLPPNVSTYILQIDLDGHIEASYKAKLFTKKGSEVWQSKSLYPNYTDSLVISFPASFLRDTSYKLQYWAESKSEKDDISIDLRQ